MICILLFSVAAIPASAASQGANIFVDGVKLQSKSVNKNGVSFVPFRELFERLNMSVKYDAKLKQVTGSKNDLKIVFTLGSKTVTVNGQKKALQAAPFSQNGTTLIPIRIVGEATGNAVYWHADVNAILINSPTFQGITYTIDGENISFGPNGSITWSPGTPETFGEQSVLRELAEIDSIERAAANLPKIRIVGQPPTEEESKYPGYKGYPDYYDVNYVTAIEKNKQLPPLMSEGWITLALLSEIEKINNLGSKAPNTITIGKYVGYEMIRFDIVMTDAYKKAKEGDFVLSDIRVKKYNGTMYLNIEDLKNTGLIES